MLAKRKISNQPNTQQEALEALLSAEEEKMCVGEQQEADLGDQGLPGQAGEQASGSLMAKGQ